VTRIKDKVKAERGAAAVEFALIAPLLFMLIFGIIQFGLAWSQKEVFIQAAREGARYAAVGCEDATGCSSGEVATRVDDALVGYQVTGGTGAIAVTPNPGCTNTNQSDTVEVSWSQQFQIDIPFVPPVTVTAPIEAVFRCEV
jgi:Flp pilus assembly protein TadG